MKNHKERAKRGAERKEQIKKSVSRRDSEINQKRKEQISQLQMECKLYNQKAQCAAELLYEKLKIRNPAIRSLRQKIESDPTVAMYTGLIERYLPMPILQYNGFFELSDTSHAVTVIDLGLAFFINENGPAEQHKLLFTVLFGHDLGKSKEFLKDIAHHYPKNIPSRKALEAISKNLGKVPETFQDTRIPHEIVSGYGISRFLSQAGFSNDEIETAISAVMVHDYSTKFLKKPPEISLGEPSTVLEQVLHDSDKWSRILNSGHETGEYAYNYMKERIRQGEIITYADALFETIKQADRNACHLIKSSYLPSLRSAKIIDLALQYVRLSLCTLEKQASIFKLSAQQPYQ